MCKTLLCEVVRDCTEEFLSVLELYVILDPETFKVSLNRNICRKFKVEFKQSDVRRVRVPHSDTWGPRRSTRTPLPGRETERHYRTIF